MVCVLLTKFYNNFIDHLISNILIPHLSRLAQKCKRGDYCYANGQKIAGSSNDYSSNNMLCPIDKRLLESKKPFNSKHFDTSFDQIDRKM